MIVSAPEFFTRNIKGFVVHPLRILLIIVLALVIRALVGRAISRLTRSSSESDLPLMLRPLGERAVVQGFLSNAGLISERRRLRAETIGSVLRSITSLAIFAIAAMLVLGELEVNLAPVIASAGILGLALGFGAQNLVKDFVAGIFMILEDQYGVGDVIDVGEVAGTVESVGLRTTRIRDERGTVWYVRNGEVDRVGNQSQGFAQVIIDLPVPATADLNEARRAIKTAANSLWQDAEWSAVILEEPNMLGIEQLNPDNAVLRLTVKTRPLQQWRVGRELRQRIKNELGT
ncbi:MAG: moderate conductance mechanosensitive channel [Mycobacteriales bacterium]